MDQELGPDLLIRAAGAYRRVVADPETWGPEAARLVVEARQANEPGALVAALRAEAWFERTRLSHDRAKALLDEAVRTARRHRLDARLGDVLVTRGAVNHELGRLASARHDFDRAAGLIGPETSAELSSQRGALAQNTGRLSDAARLYRSVLADPGCPNEVRVKVANNLGLIEAQRGRPRAALDCMEEAAAAAREVGPAVEAIVAEGRAWVTVQAGRLADGLALFDEASRRWDAVGLPLGELHAEYADVLADLRLIPEATEQARRAVAMLEEPGVLLMVAEARLRVARLALLANDLGTAASEGDRAVALLRRQRRASWAARASLVAVDARLQAGQSRRTDFASARRSAATLERCGMASTAVEAHLSAGRVAAALRRPAAAASSFARAFELSRDAPVLVRLKGRVAAALAARLRQRDHVVLHHSRAGLKDVARHRSALPSMELRALASGHGAELGRLGLESLVRTGSAAQVLGWMERTRAAALSAVEPPAVEGIEEELAALRAVHADLLQAQRETGTKPAGLLARQAALERRIRQATWTRRPAGTTAGTGFSTSVLRRLLEGRVLVEYDVLDGEVVAAVLEARRTRLVPLGPLDAVRYEIDALLFALRRLCRGGAAAAMAAARSGADFALSTLADRLIRPLALPEHRGLVVVPVADLQRIPWCAVHTEPVSIAPSAKFWARSAQRKGSPAVASVVLVAGPELPGSAAEIDALRALHDQPEVLVPPASRVEAVARALDGATLAHLACHGHVRVDNPTFSSLLLCDGPLTVHELDLRNIAPHRIVLAACESGSDVAYEGNEALGFVSALMARGTAGLVASAVVVPDWNTVPLMRALHEEVRRGATLAEALHAARETVDREDPSSFVSWCAFNAFGAA